MNELKPCPFCGGKAEFERVGNNRQSEIISCTECGCRLESNLMDWNAGDYWNMRHGIQDKDNDDI